jgi:preprotein translocase subunit SecD
MKTIKRSLVAIFILGIIATGFSQKQHNTNQILIQSTDHTISGTTLSQSAEIISNRLESYSDKKFEIIIISDKNQIQLVLSDSWDMEVAENLITQKGTLSFYETYFYKDLTELIKADTTLLSLLQVNAPGDSSERIICTTAEETIKLKEYLTSVEMKHSCKFAWSNKFDDSLPCLYALKIGNGSGLNLKGSDIESFNFGQDSIWKINYFGFQFQQSAIPVWAEITKRNINRALAIVLDDNVLFAPMVREEIYGGNCQLSGSFTLEQVRCIASVCKNGELPVSFEIVN